jgi:hypothetical protein
MFSLTAFRDQKVIVHKTENPGKVDIVDVYTSVTTHTVSKNGNND